MPSLLTCLRHLRLEDMEAKIDGVLRASPSNVDCEFRRLTRRWLCRDSQSISELRQNGDRSREGRALLQQQSQIDLLSTCNLTMSHKCVIVICLLGLKRCPEAHGRTRLLEAPRQTISHPLLHAVEALQKLRTLEDARDFMTMMVTKTSDNRILADHQTPFWLQLSAVLGPEASNWQRLGTMFSIRPAADEHSVALSRYAKWYTLARARTREASAVGSNLRVPLTPCLPYIC